LYSLLRHKNINAKNTPTNEEVQNFWTNIWEKRSKIINKPS